MPRRPDSNSPALRCTSRQRRKAVPPTRGARQGQVLISREVVSASLNVAHANLDRLQAPRVSLHVVELVSCVLLVIEW